MSVPGIHGTVSMPIFNADSMRGVCTIDFDFTTKAQTELEKSRSYAFLLDGQGYVLLHPLLPTPIGRNSDFADIKIEVLEGDGTSQKEVYHNMTKGPILVSRNITTVNETSNETEITTIEETVYPSGSAVIMLQSIVSKGFTHREGIIVNATLLTYYYKQVSI